MNTYNNQYKMQNVNRYGQRIPVSNRQNPYGQVQAQQNQVPVQQTQVPIQQGQWADQGEEVAVQHPTVQTRYPQPTANQIPVQYRQVPQTEFKPATQDAVMSQRPMDLDTKSMDRDALLEYMYPQHINVKFADQWIDPEATSTSLSKMHPGWLEPTTDDFFTRITDEPIMLKEGRVIKMTSQVHDIDQFEVDPLFDIERHPDNEGVSTGLEKSIETKPKFGRKRLVAVNMVYHSWLTKNFLLGNIKKDNFHQWYYSMMGDKSGLAWMTQGLYSSKAGADIPVGSNGTALKHMNGVLKQCLDTNVKWQENKRRKDPAGFSKIGYGDNVSDAIDTAITKYSDQMGASKNAKLILPSNVRMRLAIEVKNNKDSDFASQVYLKGPKEQHTIYGKPLLENDELEKVFYGWDSFKVDEEGYPSSSGTKQVTDVVYGYYGDPKNIFWGMLKDAELESSYEQIKRSYLVSVALAGDVIVNYPQDTIVIPFALGNKQNE